MVYQISNWFGTKIFGMPLTSHPYNLRLVEIIGNAVAFGVHFILPFFLLPFKVACNLIFVFSSIVGVCYFLNVAPNHDTMSSHEALNGKDFKGMDWGELQVRSSCNHSVGDSFMDKVITSLWGGMNYQIEHHLFPSMSHCHYSTIAPIVRETCREFGIPYPHYKSWYGAMKSYLFFLKIFEEK